MKFPKKLFVKIDGRKGEEYFDPHQAIDTTVDAGESAKVAIYGLIEIVEASGSVTTVSTKRRK
jgi:hypothetical protein